MRALVLRGLVAAFFFSLAFLVIRWANLGGGHWVWNGCLRYVWIVPLLASYLVLRDRSLRSLAAMIDCLRCEPRYWMIVGAIGVVGFYGPLSYAAARTEAWVIAATWQVTLLFGPLAFLALGRSLPHGRLAVTGLIVVGIWLVHAHHDWRAMLPVLFPLMVAGFCYPLGNQLMADAASGRNRRLFRLDYPAMRDPAALVLMQAVGSLPGWLVVIVVTEPLAGPTGAQLVKAGLVAVLASLIATTIFLSARAQAHAGAELAAVEATQASEVLFVLVGELLLFTATPWPTATQLLGLALITGGLILHSRESSPSDPGGA